MFRQAANQLKNFDFLQKISEGYYLDAKDQGRWKVGQVQQIQKLGHKWIIDVMFDGYSYKFNQRYDLPSYSKLAPFRKHTLPYTGSSMSQVKRQQPNKTIQHYIKTLAKIYQDIQGQKSQYINQFIRGQLFIFVDFILTRPMHLDIKYPFDDCYRFLIGYIELFDKVMEKIFEFLKEVEKEGNLDQNFVYVHSKMAWLYSITEFLFNCNSLISKTEERVTFYKRFGRHQSAQQIYIQFLQKFKSIQLYEKCQRLMNFKALNNKSLPWSIKKQCLILMKSLNKQQPFIIPKDSKQIIQFFEFFSYFNKKNVISMDQQDKYRIEVIFNLILGGNFQGKLVGLSQLKKLISSTSMFNKKDSLILENIKQRKLINFFLDNNNFNSELFKRSIIVFEYAYKHKLFTKDHFIQIFKLHKDKHELELMNFYNSLAQFGIFLSPNDAYDYFQMMIKELPFEENFIELIKNYTIILIDKNSHYKKQWMLKDQQGYGLIYFWEQINNQNKVNKPLIPKIIEGFATLLNNIYYGKQIQRFVVSSIKAIKGLKNPESFLKVIHESLKLCKGQKMNRAIQTAQKQINVIQVAINVLKQSSDTLSKTGFQNLFQFLQQVNYISRRGISLNDILFMWKLQKSKCRTHLLKFLRKYKLRSSQDKSHQKIIYKALQVQQIQFIIKNIFQSDQLMQNYKQIDQQLYQTVDQLILCYLNAKKFIEYNYKHTIRFKKNEFFCQDGKMFLGLKFYLKCIENPDQKFKEVSVKATKRVVEIYLRPLNNDFNKNVTDAKISNWLRVSKFFNQLKHNKLRSIQIQLEEIYGRMKSLNILQPENLDIKAQLFGTNKVHVFSVPRYTSLWKFRLILNEYFDLKDSNFEIRLVEQETYTNLQRQEDLSVAFIKLNPQKNGVSVVIKPSNQQHPHFKAIQKFKQQLSHLYGESYFQNLSFQNEQKAKVSLDILFKLPFIKSLQKSIQNFDFKDWSEVLDLSNMKKLEYQLRIIQKNKDLKWLQAFIAKNGIKHLGEIVLNNIGKQNYKTLNILMSFFIQPVKFIMKNPLPFGESFLKDILYYQTQVTQQYVNYLYNCFSLIRQCSKTVRLTTFFEKQKMNKILEIVLFSKKSLSNNVTSQISTHIIEISKSMGTFLPLNKHLRVFLNIEYLTSKMYSCRSFFQILQTLIEKGQLQLILQPLQKIIVDIRNSDIRQKHQNQVNQLLYGYLLCLYQFIKVKNRIQQILAEKTSTFISYLLKQCLFHPTNISLRKFKSKQLRELGFKFLEMMQFEAKNQDQINSLLIPMMSKGAWRRQFQWYIEPVEIINKKFTGLKNLAATCYINSLLQQLFYIKNFSTQLMAIDSTQIDDKENIVRQIQNIFGYLKYTQNPSYTTASLCQNFILDGQPIDPRIQTDVDEFFHALMDKLERNLAKINKKDIINQVFGGEFSNLIIGQQCPHTSQRIEHFLSIRLQIKNKKTIYQALDQFIKGQVLQGENAYFCQKCDKKVKALKRVCLKDLPQIMIVTLKRFQFDFDTMQKFKLNTYCSFPQTINFLPYTKQGLQQEVDVKKQDYDYKLKGVIIHYGISEAGHYTTYVRTDDKNWNYFDDERISEFDLQNMENECFGGIEENPFGDDQDKKKNAYVLLYEKVKSSSSAKAQQHCLKQVPQQVLLQTKVHQLVQQDNMKTKMVNILFQPNIQSYIFNSSQINPKAFLIYYHTVFLRNCKKRQKYVQFYTKCAQLLQKKAISQWYLSQITQSFLLQFVIHGSYQVQHIVTSLICRAMRYHVDLEFIQQCISMLYVKNIIPFVKIFSIAYFSQNEYAKYLSSINFSEVVVNLIKGKDIKENNVINKVQVRKNISEFGLAASSFIQRKNFDPKDLFQAIEGFKTGLSMEEIKQLAFTIKNKRTLRSLASITARKFRQLDQLKKLMDSYLVNELFTFDPKVGEQNYFYFLIYIVQQLCKIRDKQQQQRVVILMKFYVQLIKDALCGFKCELVLLNAFFRMTLTNSIIRNVIAAIFNEKQGKKVVTMIKDWLKQLPNCISQINKQNWGWWKKPKKTSYHGLTTKYVEGQIKPVFKQALSLLNSICEKHINEDVSESLQIGNIGYTEQRGGNPQYNKIVKVTRKMGFLVQIKDQEGNHKFISQDEVFKKFV